MRIVFFGRNEILYETIRRFLELGKENEVAGILTAPGRPEYLRDEADYKELARGAQVPFRFVDRSDHRSQSETKEWIKSLQPDLGISLNWISVLDQSSLDLFKKGVLNIHFGDLPSYRGNAVTNWALLAGEKKIALTVHKMMGSVVDQGQILLKDYVSLDESTTIRDINAQALERVPLLVERAIKKIADPPAVLDNLDEGFRCYPRLPRDGKIDWHQSAIQIHRLVRSLTRPYSGAYTYFRDSELRKVFIWKSHVLETSTRDRATPGHILKNCKESGSTSIMTGQGVLSVDEVSYGEGEEPFQPGKRWKSIRNRLGMDIEAEIFRIQEGLSK